MGRSNSASWCPHRAEQSSDGDQAIAARSAIAMSGAAMFPKADVYEENERGNRDELHCCPKMRFASAFPRKRTPTDRRSRRPSMARSADSTPKERCNRVGRRR